MTDRPLTVAEVRRDGRSIAVNLSTKRGARIHATAEWDSQ